MHYSLSTEQVYVYWVRFFIRWSARGGGMRHPREMGAADVEAFLTMLATQRKVSASTHNQALSAILFLYRVVMLPRSLEPALRLQMLAARAQWEADRLAQRGGVETPHALEQKYPKVGYTWGWFWTFPSPTPSNGARVAGTQRRFDHHD